MLKFCHLLMTCYPPTSLQSDDHSDPDLPSGKVGGSHTVHTVGPIAIYGVCIDSSIVLAIIYIQPNHRYVFTGTDWAYLEQGCKV